MDGVTDSDGLRQITGDLVGEASRVAEASFDNEVVAMFLHGASGDQTPREKAKYRSLGADGALVEKQNESDGFAIIKKLGGLLGNSILHTAKELCIESQISELRHSNMTIACPKQKRPFEGFPVPSKNIVSVPDGEMETAISILSFGKKIVLLGIKPEINCITGFAIKRDSPFKYTLVIQMVNGAQKYMADNESYLHMTYEAMNSSFGIGAAEYLHTQVCIALRELQ
jgi:hypothetical protein